jgi:CO dehydrogenase/acetyl-CoA synthase alpha subunit
MFNDIADYLGMNIAATVLALGAYKLGAVSKHTSVLAKARQAGKQAVNGAS